MTNAYFIKQNLVFEKNIILNFGVISAFFMTGDFCTSGLKKNLLQTNKKV
jgi:hypothetical protein